MPLYSPTRPSFGRPDPSPVPVRSVLSALSRCAVEIRAAWRLLRLCVHLLLGIARVRLLFPWLSAKQREHHKQAWSAAMIRMLGVRLQQDALPLPQRCVVVCNHISWLDIFVINALVQTWFVSKDDVRHWPLIGWLVDATGTIFIDRTRRSAAAQTLQALQAKLQTEQARVTFFPEGTTTDGSKLLPFSAALFEAARHGETQVAALSLRYLDPQGQPSRAPAYDGDVSFMECLLAIVRSPRIEVSLELAALLPAGLERREYARQSRQEIARALGQPAEPVLETQD
jgi:1-acyl-sn-glycerol-3-phosphate acyltransferase